MTNGGEDAGMIGVMTAVMTVAANRHPPRC
jgi:hypothetical protein